MFKEWVLKIPITLEMLNKLKADTSTDVDYVTNIICKLQTRIPTFLTALEYKYSLATGIHTEKE